MEVPLDRHFPAALLADAELACLRIELPSGVDGCADPSVSFPGTAARPPPCGSEPAGGRLDQLWVQVADDEEVLVTHS